MKNTIPSRLRRLPAGDGKKKTRKETYTNMKFNTIKPIVKTCLKKNQPVMLLGDAGIGKSSFLKDVADKATSPVFTVTVNQMEDKADLSGLRLMPIGKKDENGQEIYAQKYFPHITIMECILYAKEHPDHTPILFMDEINRAGSDVTSACLSLMTERAIGDKKIPDNVRFVFAGNHNGNVTALDEASISRFTRYFVEPDLETFLDVNPNLHPNIKEVLEANPDALCCRKIVEVSDDGEDDGNDLESLDQMFEQDQSFEQITTPRTITALSEFLNDQDANSILSMVREETLEDVLQGFTGDTKFTALLCQSIATKFLNSMAPASASQVKPPRYDALKACRTIQDLETQAQSMSPGERCQILAYALCERADNRNLVRAVAKGLSASGTDINAVMQAISSGNMNPDNKDAFRQMAAESPLAAMFQNFLV